LSDPEFDALFTTNQPIILAFHAYPWPIHRLTYRRANHANLHVRNPLLKRQRCLYFTALSSYVRQRTDNQRQRGACCSATTFENGVGSRT
jgi:hypothetical protein